MDNKKKLEKPEVEFVKVQAEDVVVASPGSQVAFCNGTASSNVNCQGTGNDFNY